MSDAMSLVAVRVALEVDEVERSLWPDYIRRAFIVHGETSRIMEQRRKVRGARG